MNRLTNVARRWPPLALVATVALAASAGRAVAQQSLMPAPRWWPSSGDDAPRLTVVGSAFHCPLDRCDRAAALGADARLTGSFHVAVDARMPGFDYTAWYGWRRVSIGATVGSGATFPLIAVLRSTSMIAAAVSDTVRRPIDSVRADDGSHRTTHWSSTAARLTWRADRWWITGLLGRVTVTGQRAAPWAAVQLGANITNGASLLLGLGTTSHIAALAAPEPLRHNLSLGLGFNASILARKPSAHAKASSEALAAFTVSSVGVDRVRITVRSPSARAMEFASDCTGWKPLQMTQTRDSWIIEVAAQRGLHRANIRVDGGHWIAPPGLASSDDDFAGEVGIFVVE